MTTQRITYTITVDIDNTKGIRHNADEIGRNLVGWSCSPECESSYDLKRVIVHHAQSDTSVEWAQTGGKKRCQ